MSSKLKGSLLEGSGLSNKVKKELDIESKSSLSAMSAENRIMEIFETHDDAVSYMGGHDAVHNKGYNVPARGKVLRENNIESAPKLLRQGFSTNIAVDGIDYKDLAEKFPVQRYKFYFSISCVDQKDFNTAEEMFLDIIALAKKEKVSLAFKTETHDYDSLLLYTFHQQELYGIIQEVYNKYKHSGIFREVPRVFQGPLENVDPSHIGWVQEPIGGHGGSHTSRMNDLAVKIKSGESFEKACKEIGINPDMPWLLDMGE